MEGAHLFFPSHTISSVIEKYGGSYFKTTKIIDKVLFMRFLATER